MFKWIKKIKDKIKDEYFTPRTPEEWFYREFGIDISLPTPEEFEEMCKNGLENYYDEKEHMKLKRFTGLAMKNADPDHYQQLCDLDEEYKV